MTEALGKQLPTLIQATQVYFAYANVLFRRVAYVGLFLFHSLRFRGSLFELEATQKQFTAAPL